MPLSLADGILEALLGSSPEAIQRHGKRSHSHPFHQDLLVRPQGLPACPQARWIVGRELNLWRNCCFSQADYWTDGGDRSIFVVRRYQAG